MSLNVIFSDFSYEILPKQKEIWERYCKVLQWGRKHPTRFVEEMLGVQLTDYQKYIFMNCWTARTAVVLCSRGTGKSFFSAPFIMTRSLLIPNHKTYVLSVSGGQASETFKKIKKRY